MKKYKKWLIFKIVFILALVALLLIKKPESLSIAISMIVVMIVITFLRLRNPESYKTDERTEKLSAYASSWSWMATLTVVTLLYWNDYIQLVSLTAHQVITIIFIVMIASIVLTRLLLFKRPDIK